MASRAPTLEELKRLCRAADCAWYDQTVDESGIVLIEVIAQTAKRGRGITITANTSREARIALAAALRALTALAKEKDRG